MALAILLLAGVPGTTRAASASQAGVLRVGTPGDYAPYSWYDAATSTYRGSDIALARALALELGLRPQFVATAWSTLMADAAAGKFDVAVGGISITADRRRILDFSTPYASDRKQPVVRCGEERRFDSEAEINRAGVRLIVNPGGTNEQFARAKFPAATLVVHADNRSVFDEIRSGRADVMVTDAVEGRLQQRAKQGLCVANVRSRWAPADKALLIARTSAPVHGVDKALDQLGGVRRYRRGLSDWEGYDWAGAAEPSVQLAALIDERLALVVEVARAKWNSGAAIEDAAREQALLQTLRARAAASRMPVAEVETFFVAQIEAAKMLQRELFSRWRKQRRGPFVGVADLAVELRPAIDQVTTAMLEQLQSMSGKNSRSLPAASTVSLVSAAAVEMARSPVVRRELKNPTASR